MFHRGSGVIASGSVVRTARARKLLLGSTALIAAGLAATPAAAQLSPAGGGTITGAGTATGGGANQGVLITGATTPGIIVSGVTISNGTGSPTIHGYRQDASNEVVTLQTRGINSITTTSAGGAAIYLSGTGFSGNGSVNWVPGYGDTASVTDLTGSYGAYLTSANAGVTVNASFGGANALRNITANGSAVAGIYANAGNGRVALTLGTPVISGFATGIDIHATASGNYLQTTGGSIGGTTYGIATNQATSMSIGGAVSGGTAAISFGSGNYYDTLSLTSAASISGNVYMREGVDLFIWGGGTLSGGTIDGGDGFDTFRATFDTPTTTRSLNQASVTGFEAYNLTSGRLTLTGNRDGGAGWVADSDRISLNGALTNVTGTGIRMTVAGAVSLNAAGQLSATGSGITLAVAGSSAFNTGGTITAGSADGAHGVALISGSVVNSGTITYASGGAITAVGYGVYTTNTGGNSTITNNAGGSITGHWGGVRLVGPGSVFNTGAVRGDRFAGIETNGTTGITNNTGGGIYGAGGEAAGILVNDNAVSVTNNTGAAIAGEGNGGGITNRGTGLLTVSNDGTIGAGTIDGGGAFVAGGSEAAIISGNANITNSSAGVIDGASGGIRTSGTLTLTNRGTITGRGTGTGSFDGVNTGGVATIVNSGTISNALNAGVYLGAGGTVTNAAGGALTGGNGGGGAGVGISLVGGTFNNYGSTSSTTGNGIATSGTTALNLFSGSVTGAINGGAGDDTLSIYSGRGTADTAVTDDASGITLQNAGTLAAAGHGAIDLGGGVNTLNLRGTGTGAAFSGAAGSFDLAGATGVTSLRHLDSGNWTLTGAAASGAMSIYQGVGGNAGTLSFSGTSGLTGDIYVVSGAIYAAQTGAFGTGTIHMIDPTVQFGAAGIYANNYSLEVAAPASSDPTVFQSLAGGAITLSGAITTGTGNNANGQPIAADQYVTFDGSGNNTFILTNTANSWSGVTQINAGQTLRGSAATISGGSIVDNGTLYYSDTSTVAQAISGTGNVIIAAAVTMSGANSWTGTTTINNGSSLSGTASSIAGSSIVNNGGSFGFGLVYTDTVAGTISQDISGNGTTSLSASGPLTLNGNITTQGTLLLNSFSGNVTLNGTRSGGTTAAIYGTGTLNIGATGVVQGGNYHAISANNQLTVNNLGTISTTGLSFSSGFPATVGTGIGAAISVQSQLTLTNGSASNSTASITGATAGIYSSVNSAARATITNYGTIQGTGDTGIYATSTGSSLIRVTNQAGGSIGGTTTGILVEGAAILRVDNAGSIAGTVNDGVRGTGTGGVTVVNRAGGTITASGNNAASNGVYVNSGQALTVVNAGSISSTANAGVASQSDAGLLIVRNANGATIQGGSSIYGQAVQLNSAAGSTLDNYGTILGGAGTTLAVNSQNNAYTVNLFAGSTTGNIALGSGDDSVSLYNGVVGAAAATVSDPILGSAFTLRAAGNYDAAVFGALNLGGGANTLSLRGTGDGSANGAAGSLNLSNTSGISTLQLMDAGTWTITGNAAGIGTINAGNATQGGTLIFNGASNLTAGITVNGAIIRAVTAGGFGTGTITTIDPTIQYGATGTYSNNIVLNSANPAGDPTRIQADAGVTATLTGLISQGGGTQPLVFDGLGTVILTNGANNYAGLTTIASGTVVERNTGSALGSGGVTVASGATLQFDNQSGSVRYIEGGTYSGAGTIRFTGNASTALGNGGNGNTVFSLSQGGLIDVASGTVNGSSSAQGFFTNNRGSLNIAAGAIFDGVEGVVIVDSLTGAGTLRGGFFGSGSTTVGIANGSGTFSGSITDSTNFPSPLTLIKVGTGTQTLTGTGTYTGTTTINGGTLAVQNGSAIANTGTVQVGAAGTFQLLSSETIGTLTGSGATSIAGTLTLAAASGTYTGNITGGALAIGAGNWTYGGTRSGGTASAIALTGNNVTLNVAATGSILGGNYAGVSVVGAGSALNNLGSISNTGGIAVAINVLATSGTTTITNGSLTNGTATLTGRSNAINHDQTGTGALTVENYGSITGDLDNGISNQVGSGALIVRNYAGGTITGQGNAGGSVAFGNGVINLSIAALTVENAGTIAGRGFGIRSAGALTLTNDGTITGTGTASSYGVRTNAGGTITNNVTGTISATGYGLVAGGAATTIANYGTIESANGDAAILLGGGTLTNYGSGTLRATATGGSGMVAQSLGAALDNRGAIVADLGMVSYLASGSTAANSGTITATDAAFLGFGTAFAVTNTGTASGASGVRFDTGGSVTNSGSLTGSAYGVESSGGAVTITNSGTLSGSTAAISLSGSFDDTVTLNAGAVTGDIALGDGNDTLNWNGGTIAGAISGGNGSDVFDVALGAGNSASIDATRVTEFEFQNHQSGTLTLTGNGSLDNSWLVSNGAELIVAGQLDAQYSVGVGLNNGSALSVTGGLSSVYDAVATGGAVIVTNSGDITGGANGIYAGGGALTLTNSGTITGGSGSAVDGQQGGTITNLANGEILAGGSGAAITLAGANNYTLDLQANSTVTGNIVSGGAGGRTVDIRGTIDGMYDASTGTGVDTVSMYDGSSLTGGNLGDGDDVFNYFGGTITGVVEGGAGTDSLFADFGSGSSGTVTLANFTGFESFGFGSGDVTVTGPSSSPDADIYSQNGGTVTFSGTESNTGDIYADGGDIRAATAGAFGSGTVHMIDASAYYGASGVYANDISLEVQAPAASNPATLSADAGVVATLTGAITQGTGPGVDPVQPLTFAGSGIIVLTNTANNWTGTTTIASGATLEGTTATISGSNIVANGTLNYFQPTSGTVTQDISGNGRVTVAGLGAGEALTLGGTTSVRNGVDMLDGSTLINAGTISTASADSVDIYGGGRFINNGTVTNAVVNWGVADSEIVNNGALNNVSNFNDSVMTVTNNAGASISASVINFGAGALTVNNGGDISGSNTAVRDASGVGVINNTGRIIGGTITGATYDTDGFASVVLDNGGTVNNLAGGLIDGRTGIYSEGALVLVNADGATLQGTEAINAYNAAADITNAGTIASTGTDEYAIGLGAGGVIRNAGSIDGGAGASTAITGQGGPLTVINQAGGTISGNSAAITNFGDNAFTVDLQAGSTTTGSVINIGNGPADFTIAGTVTAGTIGLGGGDGSLTLTTGATLGAGVVLAGGAGSDTLALTGAGNGSLNLTNVNGFELREMNGTGTWTVSGTDATPGTWAINSGVLAVSGGAAINDLAGVTIAAPGTLQLLNNERIAALNGMGNVDLGANTLTVGGGGSGSYAGVIGGSGSLVVTNGSTLTLSGANTFTGTAYAGTSGTLRLGASDVLADGATLQVAVGGTADVQGYSDTVAHVAIEGALNGTGTLTASDYQLNGATVNANLGAGTLFQFGGTSTLNGTAGASAVIVLGGTLALGAADRFADSAAVQVASGATLDLGAYDDTVSQLELSGTLAGTGTITAVEYDLIGAVVNANLGGGVIDQVSGTSVLNGTAAADTVYVNGGTLQLGASDRLVDTADIGVASGATLDLGAFDDTVSTASIQGMLAGTGTLTATLYDLNGAVVDANLGGGTLFNTGGTSVLNGTSAADVAIVAGTLALGASDRLGDTATVVVAPGATFDLGAFSDTVGLLGLSGTLAGTGTLTATEYQLDGAVVDANLGAGTLLNTGGVSVLNGISAADTVGVTAGTLALGAADRLSDSATLMVASGATLDLGAFDETVGLAGLSGTLAGTGTLTAAEYQLDGGTVNANLGAGTLLNLGGASVLNGTSAAGTVGINAGTLSLGASDRLADTATLMVASGATFDLGAFSETVGLAGLSGTLAGTGTLTAAEYQLDGGTVNANLGAGTLLNMGGASVLNGTSAAGTVGVNAGTLTLGASDRLADAATLVVASGATLDLGGNSDTVALAGLSGTLAGTGTLTAGSYELNGATVNANLGAGTLLNTGGASVLNGTSAAGTVGVNVGTLSLGASDRLADAATLVVATGATLDLGAFNDTVGVAGLNGTLAGTGTLTASEYQLNGATVNANLGAGALFQLSGTSVLNGSSAAGTVGVNVGTLALGASDRLGDAATVMVATGATLDLGAFGDTVSALGLSGTLAGTGTLTASEYQLNGAAVNANLGTGTLVQVSGTSVLTGASAATNVGVNGGTLRLGASDRLADTATVVIATGATLDLGANSDTVGLAVIGGTLAGTGTLGAAEVQLAGATVNANLGGGTLFNVSGSSTLNGTSGASLVNVQGGTLALGASDRLADSTQLAINSGGTFSLDGLTETVGSLTNGASGGGTLELGTGRLVLAGNGDYGFSGAITGAGSLDHTGTGQLTLAGDFGMTGRLDVSAGTLAFLGTSLGSARVQGGALIGDGSFAGNLAMTSGTLAPGGLGSPVQPVGGFQAQSLNISGGSLLFDFGGANLGNVSDTIRVTGPAVLSGGTVNVNALSATDQYAFNNQYLIVQAGSLTGTFANGTTFAAVSNDAGLQWRLRYDLVPNAVVLQVQKNIDFAAAVANGSPNQQAVGTALSGGAGSASDQWAQTLNTIAALSPSQRGAAYDSLNGEALADTSTSSFMANKLFLDMLHQRIGGGGDAMSGTGLAGGMGDIRVATRDAGSMASRLSANRQAYGAGGGDGSSGAMWSQAYGGYQRLTGRYGQASLDTSAAGVAMGAEGRLGDVMLGVAGGLTEIGADVDARGSNLDGRLYQAGGYASYDDGVMFASLAGNYYSGRFESLRQIDLGGALRPARAHFRSHGYGLSVAGGARIDLGDGLRAVLSASASKTRDSRNAFTETAAGGVGLTSAAADRDLFTATGDVKLGQWIRTGAGYAMPYVNVGVRYNAGDLDTLGNMRFSGAPANTGAFQIQGARIDSLVGTFGAGVDVRASDRVSLGVAVENAYGSHTRETRAALKIKIGF